MNGTDFQKEAQFLNSFFPKDVTPFEHQVAGHSSENGKSVLGLLKNNDGYVLKPILKPIQGNREKKFYSDLQLAIDAVSTELRKFVPEYLGSTVLNIDKTDVEFLILKNVTQDYKEPCVMDIKIGKQTWDPEATPEKREHEDRKYMQSKQELGFCIPGFQVHNIATGKFIRMEKDFGKTLTKHTTKDAFKLFFNTESGLSRHLLLQLLAHLWHILQWCRMQRKYHFYSSSLLIVYDAQGLRQCLKKEPMTSFTQQPPSCIKSASSENFGTAGYINNLRSGQLLSNTINGELHSLNHSPTRSGSSSPVNQNPTQSLQRQNTSSSLDINSWHNTLNRACISRTHSFVSNYEMDMQNMKDDYLFQLNNLMQSDTGNPSNNDMWLTVKMIDFAHAFPATCAEEDSNYLGGIESLVKMIEELIEETTC